MFQREFAMRLVAKPESDLYCRLSVNAQLLARIDHVMKVGRNNFRPPPQVESSVVRMEPFVPGPQIDIDEFDGLLRVLFVRKNKTVGANFRTKSVLQMLEHNYKTMCALNGVDVPMDFDVKQAVHAVLGSLEMESTRVAKMDQGDYLRLLAAFNDAGFRFRS